MKRIHTIATTAFALFIVAFASAQTIDPDQSQVNFEVSNMSVRTVEGSLGGMKGSIQFDPNQLNEAKFNVCVGAGSIDTDNDSRDKHLRKEDYFHVEKYTTICFVSDAVSPSDDGYFVSGKLTMHGITKDVIIPFTYKDKQFRGTFTVNRTDYEIGGNGTFMIGDEVEVEIVCTLK